MAPYKPAVAGLQQHVEHFLLGDGVADLHRAAADLFRFGGQLDRGKRRPVDAVAPGAAADRDDQVAGLRFLVTAVHRDQADGAAINQRIGQVALVETDRPVDGGNAHAVAVIADAGDDALHDRLRMQDAGRQGLRRRVGRGETKDVGVADRLGAQAGAQRIADDAAQAGVGAAVGFDRRRMVVRLDLEADVIAVVEFDDAGVVLEDADAPIVAAEPPANLLGGAEDRFLEQIVDAPALEVDRALERLVRAMFRPGLGDAFPVRCRSDRGPASRKWAWIAFISSRRRASWPSRLTLSSAASSSVSQRHDDAMKL